MFDLLLIIVFIGSAGALWYRVSEKIPELVAIPDEVIVDRLHDDSARVRVFLLNLKHWWREEQYREPLWRFCEKVVYRLHIFLLRADNGMMALLKKVRSLGGLPGNGNGNRKGDQIHEAEPETTPPASPSFRSALIQEVRRKKVKSVVPE